MQNLSDIEIIDTEYPEGLISKDEISLQPDLRLSVLLVSWVSMCWALPPSLGASRLGGSQLSDPKCLQLTRSSRDCSTNSLVTHRLINWLTEPFPPNLQDIINPKTLELGSWSFERMCTPNKCHMTHVMCHMSGVTSQFFFFFFSPTRPHWAELVIESPCPDVSVIAPSGAVFF